jgi:hypothetical protein
MTLFQLADVVAWHKYRHEGRELDTQEVDLSNDKVLETDKSKISINVFTIRFRNCKDVFAFFIVRPTAHFVKEDLPQQDLIRRVLTDARLTGLEVQKIIADAPCRAEWRCFLGHTALFGCDLCYARKVMAAPVGTTGGKEKNCYTRGTTLNVERRTQAQVEEILRSLQGVTDKDERRETAKGVKGPAAISEFPELDIIKSIVVEPMHLLCEGVVKKVLQLIFPLKMMRAKKKPPIRAKIRKGALRQMNEKLQAIKVPKEFHRRPRPLDSNFKAVEYRNLILFYFVALLDVLEEGSDEQKMVAHLVYLARVFYLPQDEFDDQHDYRDLEMLQHAFLRLYEKAFGDYHITYNIHIWAAHAGEIHRQHGIFPGCSAFPSEVSMGKRDTQQY